MKLIMYGYIDIHLIFNLVDASKSFQSAESWTPICLPKFNDTGFLHAYVSYFPENSPACLLLISTDKEKFFELQQCKERIMEVSDCTDHHFLFLLLQVNELVTLDPFLVSFPQRLTKNNVLQQISDCVNNSEYLIS